MLAKELLSKPDGFITVADGEREYTIESLDNFGFTGEDNFDKSNFNIESLTKVRYVFKENLHATDVTRPYLASMSLLIGIIQMPVVFVVKHFTDRYIDKTMGNI